MARFIQGADRGQSTLLPECLDDWVADDNPVRVIDAFVAALDLAELGFGGVEPAGTGRPSYHSAGLLGLYIYGYLNRVHSSRRLEREAGRNVEVMWLLGLRPITKRLPISARTMVPASKTSARASSRCAARWGCSRQPASPSTAANSKPSIIAIRTSHAAKSSGGARNWRRVLRAISLSSIPPTGRSRRKRWN